MSTAADSLSSVSRKFYEDSRMKVAMSIVVAAGSMMLLGFCTIAGGNSASNTYLYKDATDKNTKNSYQNMAAGYAFATFAFILVCISYLIIPLLRLLSSAL